MHSKPLCTLSPIFNARPSCLESLLPQNLPFRSVRCLCTSKQGLPGCRRSSPRRQARGCGGHVVRPAQGGVRELSEGSPHPALSQRHPATPTLRGRAGLCLWPDRPRAGPGCVLGPGPWLSAPGPSPVAGGAELCEPGGGSRGQRVLRRAGHQALVERAAEKVISD